VGSLALNAFFIPVFGFWRTSWLVSGITAAAVVVAAGVGALAGGRQIKESI